MTPEEIYGNLKIDNWIKDTRHDAGDIHEWVLEKSKLLILDAMRQYAAQESAGFHDWMRRKMRDERHESVFRIIPEIGGTYHGSDGIRYTTSDLYAIYLKEKGGDGV